MKLSMFTDSADRRAWLENEIALIENNGLRLAKETYIAALNGTGKDDFLRMNGIPAHLADKVWNEHLDWLKGNVASLERKIRKYRRLAAESI